MYIQRISTIIVIAAASPALADVIEYEDEERPDFFAAVGGEANVSVVDFLGYDDLTLVRDQWAHLGVHFSGVVVVSGKSFGGYPNDGWGVEGYPYINLAFDQPMQWIAADLPGVTMIELYSNDQLIYTSTRLGGGGPGNFGGLISDQPFDRVRFFDPFTDVDFLDDIFFGPPIAVPAPGALAVLGGLALVIGRRRRA